MHRIATPHNPVVVETAISGTSTPSTIGQIRAAAGPGVVQVTPTIRQILAAAGPGVVQVTTTIGQVLDELYANDIPGQPDDSARFTVRWANPAGAARVLGEKKGITGKSVVDLLNLLRRQGVNVVNVEAK